ncbi:MAG: helix-turn-helix domain-containing protein [Candidatus Marinimicrobia bacterium]|nr:helix-turn-helix domain-containing protein [Candidatus Neomarinimicrobiota bacterium]
MAGVPKVAFSVAEVTRVAPVGRTGVYEALKNGRLKARKNGKRTIILADDLAEWLCSLPDYEPAA